MDMIERVAKAIFDAMDVADGLDGSAAERYARAAIEAMREPTDEMIDAGVDARRALYDRMEAKGLDTKTVLVANHPAGTIYAAMIDAALVPSPPLREE